VFLNHKNKEGDKHYF